VLAVLEKGLASAEPHYSLMNNVAADAVPLAVRTRMVTKKADEYKEQAEAAPENSMVRLDLMTKRLKLISEQGKYGVDYLQQKALVTAAMKSARKAWGSALDRLREADMALAVKAGATVRQQLEPPVADDGEIGKMLAELSSYENPSGMMLLMFDGREGLERAKRELEGKIQAACKGCTEPVLYEAAAMPESIASRADLIGALGYPPFARALLEDIRDRMQKP
jgi:hypothetical protein